MCDEERLMIAENLLHQLQVQADNGDMYDMIIYEVQDKDGNYQNAFTTKNKALKYIEEQEYDGQTPLLIKNRYCAIDWSSLTIGNINN